MPGCGRCWARSPGPPRAPVTPTCAPNSSGSPGGVGHTILVIIYHLLRTGQPYNELGAAYFDTLDTTRITHHHVQRLGQLGCEVTLTPKEVA